jgi:DNA-binding Lrp family transcriptional regulator
MQQLPKPEHGTVIFQCLRHFKKKGAKIRIKDLRDVIPDCDNNRAYRLVNELKGAGLVKTLSSKGVFTLADQALELKGALRAQHRLGLSNPEIEVLWYLEEQDPPSVVKVSPAAKALGMSPGNLRKILTKLEQAGLLRKVGAGWDGATLTECPITNKTAPTVAVAKPQDAAPKTKPESKPKATSKRLPGFDPDKPGTGVRPGTKMEDILYEVPYYVLDRARTQAKDLGTTMEDRVLRMTMDGYYLVNGSYIPRHRVDNIVKERTERDRKKYETLSNELVRKKEELEAKLVQAGSQGKITEGYEKQREQIANYRTEITALRASLRESEDALTLLRKQREDFREGVASSSDKVVALREENEQLKAELAASREANSTQMSPMDALRLQILKALREEDPEFDRIFRAKLADI